MRRSHRAKATFAAAFSFGVCLSILGSARGDEDRVKYSRDIRPILSNTCYKCHGPDEAQRQAGLRLDTQEGSRATLESGGVGIVPGKSAASLVLQRITASDPSERMPPVDSGKTLKPEEIALVKQWIDEGGNYEPHWSFVAPRRPDMPEVKHSSAVRNPIDRFILRRLEREGLDPSAEADRATLIRRVTLDLTGLPPTLAEIDNFLADDSPEAYERVVDRLLDSPHYGEHMARYWLDAARYGDTHGLHLDNERSLWPYRDWVIKAFNSNMPFDQFTVEQLAGDLLPNATVDQLVATGFNRCNVTTGEGGTIEEEFRVRYAVDRVETTSAVWLGLTLGCAVCHEHKYDPVTQKEFYQLFAYFNSLTEQPLDRNVLLPPPVVKVATPEQQARLDELRGRIGPIEKSIQDALAQVSYTDPRESAAGAAPGAPQPAPTESLLSWEEAQRAAQKPELPKPVLEAVRVERAQRTPEQQQRVRDYYLEHVYSGTRATFEPLHKSLAAARTEHEQYDASIPSSMIMQDAPERRQAYLLIRGAYDRPGEKVEPGVPAALPPLPADAPPNRLALARWLVDPAHPLTARVTVNRFWQQYFGLGIVKTAEDFGSQGEWPSHPDLLDWLATEFIESGWNVKRLQKLIVMSGTYRQSSHVTPEKLQIDAENTLLARGPRFRMDAEMVRDTALHLSGLLVTKIGGRSVKPYQPAGLWEAISYTSSNTAKFEKDAGDALYRRGLYTFWKRTSPPPSLMTFDAPSREACTVRRSRTNTPLQALVLMNDEQYVEAARHFARRIVKEGGASPEERIVYGFRLATARSPRADEIQVLRQILDQQSEEFARDAEAAEKLLGVGDSPRDPSFDARELAAWTMIANLLLNLDETVTKG